MASEKKEKILVKRKKFIEVSIPITKSKIELIGNSAKELKDRTIKLDLTRQLKGKSVELTLKVDLESEKAVAIPNKIVLMPYFIRRMIRKRISYIEDSFLTPSQESMLKIKPFLITKRRVSRAIRKTLRNKTKNWINDYVAERKDSELFNDILTNRMQKTLSLVLKKTYPLSLCEIRVLEITRPLSKEEIPEIKPKPEKEIKEMEIAPIDQLKEIEEERVKKAEETIKETQKKAADIEKEETPEKEGKKEKKPRKPRAKKETKEKESE